MFKRLIVFITGITLVIVGCKKPLEGWNKHVHDEDVLNAQNTINESLLSKEVLNVELRLRIVIRVRSPQVLKKMYIALLCSRSTPVHQ